MGNFIEYRDRNGEVMFFMNDRAKYGSGLTFLTQQDSLNWETVENPSKTFNLDGLVRETRILRGEYFKSAKGNDCFRVKEDGRHWLVSNEWGGPFNYSHYRGELIMQLPGVLYSRRASSNGGGAGMDYVVVPAGTKAEYSEADL